MLAEWMNESILWKVVDSNISKMCQIIILSKLYFKMTDPWKNLRSRRVVGVLAEGFHVYAYVKLFRLKFSIYFKINLKLF